MSYNKKKNNKSYSKNVEYDATAPYNFIGFPKEVFIRYDSVEDIPLFEKYDKSLNTGYIYYEFKNETPIFVGAEKKDKKNNEDENNIEFFKNANNEYCIPGSTMKGVVRRNTEILGFGYPEFVEDKLLLYRKFASDDISKDQYREVISLKKGENIDSVVSAGYIYKKGRDYYLSPAQKVNGKTFFAVSETTLRKLDLPEGKIQYMYDKEALLNFKGEGDKAWSDFAKNEDNRNKYYKPYSVDITFDIDSENHIEKISLKDDCKYKGILCNSNSSGVKKKHYIINPIDKTKKAYKIEDKEILGYKNDCFANKQRKNKQYYYLPGEKDSYGNVLPFFYKIEDGKVKYFGRSPYLRIFHRKSIRDCILVRQNKGIDYPNALYGYTIDKEGPTSKEKHNLKSRVSFSDVICKEPKIIKEKRKLALASPKPTSYTMYLNQDDVKLKKEVKTYSSRGSIRIRGSKFYWLHKNITNNVKKDTSDNIITCVKNILDANNIFKGKIYFENLSNDELGLLLLSLKYDDDCKENIGMAKPLGYGKINIYKTELHLLDVDDMFTKFESDYKEEDDIQFYKEAFMSYMDKYTKKLYGCFYDQVYEICDFIYSKTLELEENDVKYMDLKVFKKGKLLGDVYSMYEKYSE